MTAFNWTRQLEAEPVTASAPCRVDLGGTLDIKTFFLPLAARSPVTFNIALDLRTRVSLRPYQEGRVRVSSRGFDSVSYALDEAPFDHPLGLMFAIAAYFKAEGVHLEIDSASPPRSALGGSSVAAVALVAAFMAVKGRKESPARRRDVVLTAHAVEEGAARVPCGIQDQLAAAYGGINAWEWRFTAGQPVFWHRQAIPADRYANLNDCLLLAYGGLPHESKDINGQWISHFLSGRDRGLWHEITACAASFVEAFRSGRLDRAVSLMNREVDLRKQMTPAVFDDMGNNLVALARKHRCGARFAGAGGGGCIWALGQPGDIKSLREEWRTVLKSRKAAGLLDVRVDPTGVLVDEPGQEGLRINVT